MQGSRKPVSTATEDGLDATVEQVKGLLEEQVPLTLLMDLTSPEGPASQDILQDEGQPETPWWEQP